jgi:hypothetical protein
MSKKSTAILIPRERIEKSIYILRGEKIMLDRDLARLYNVETGRLNEQVSRNLHRFPDDFMFILSQDEEEMILDYETGKTKRGGRRKPIRAFTEQGIAMLSSVLRSERAVQVNIAIMRTFVQLQKFLASNKDLAERLDELESKYDRQFREVFDAIRKMIVPDKPKKQIGFKV